MAKLLANSGDPDQTPHSAASDLGLHCLPVTLLRVSRLQWVKGKYVMGTHYRSVFFLTHNICFLIEERKMSNILVEKIPL